MKSPRLTLTLKADKRLLRAVKDATRALEKVAESRARLKQSEVRMKRCARLLAELLHRSLEAV